MTKRSIFTSKWVCSAPKSRLLSTFFVWIHVVMWAGDYFFPCIHWFVCMQLVPIVLQLPEGNWQVCNFLTAFYPLFYALGSQLLLSKLLEILQWWLIDWRCFVVVQPVCWHLFLIVVALNNFVELKLCCFC